MRRHSPQPQPTQPPNQPAPEAKRHLTKPTLTHTHAHQDTRAAPLGRDRRHSTDDTRQRTQRYSTAAPAAHACACSVRAPLFTSFLFFLFLFSQKKKKKKKTGKKKKTSKKKKRKLGGEEEGHNHPWHTRTAHSTHTGEQEPRGPGHRTSNTTHRASTPVNRSQLAQDTADAPQQTARAH